jgi:hypothetical protein
VLPPRARAATAELPAVRVPAAAPRASVPRLSERAARSALPKGRALLMEVAPAQAVPDA